MAQRRFITKEMAWQIETALKCLPEPLAVPDNPSAHVYLSKIINIVRNALARVDKGEQVFTLRVCRSVDSILPNLERYYPHESAVIIRGIVAGVRSAFDCESANDLVAEEPEVHHFVVNGSNGVGKNKETLAGVDMVYSSKEMSEVASVVPILAQSDIAVLVQGDTGVGKELVARAIHLSSSRKDSPFFAINCAAVPENLIESELFGYKKGAFTGANSDKRGVLESVGEGTLLLDEIGDMSLPMQAKLLRALQERKFRPLGDDRNGGKDFRGRLITATNRDLRQEVNAHRFREDLFYRINGFQISVPPLRDRKEDILPIARDLIKSIRQGVALSSQAEEMLYAYEFPGNVRELDTVLQRAVLVMMKLNHPDSLDIILPEDIVFYDVLDLHD